MPAIKNGGWALPEAWRRTLDDELLEEIDALKTRQDDLQNRLAREFAIDDNNAEELHALRSEIASTKKQGQEKLSDAWHLFKVPLLSENLVGFVVDDKGVSHAIQPDLWDGVMISDFKSSSFVYSESGVLAFSAVTFYPLVETPDVTARLAGLNLELALRRCCQLDPEVAKAFRRMMRGISRPTSKEIKNFDAKPKELRVRPVTVPGMMVIRNKPPQEDFSSFDELQNAISPKQAIFTGLLQEGRLVVHALNGKGESIGRMNSNFWYFEATNYERFAIAFKDLPEFSFDPDLRNLKIELPETPLPARIDIAETDNQNRGGRPRIYPWDDVMDRIFERIGREGHPESGAELVRMICSCFEQSGSDAPDNRAIARYMRNRFPRVWKASKGEGA